jgi:hypothetical protein
MTAHGPGRDANREKFATVRSTLCASLVERDDEVDLCLTALVARKHVRPPDRPPAAGQPPVPATGRRPGDRPGGHRVPLGSQPGSIRIQRKTSSFK